MNPVHTHIPCLLEVYLLSYLLLGLPSVFFFSIFPTKILYDFIISHIRVLHVPFPHPWLDHSRNTTSFLFASLDCGRKVERRYCQVGPTHDAQIRALYGCAENAGCMEKSVNYATWTVNTLFTADQPTFCILWPHFLFRGRTAELAA
jgi:hypothetical protein